MSVLTRPLTVADLEQFPDDGRRYEIIGGELHMAAAPAKAHQRLLRRLTILIDGAVTRSDAGEVFFAPVDVQFSNLDQVQPDLIFIRKDRLDIYRGHTVFGPPDLVVEVLSPSTRAYDEGAKARLYAEAGVPELWFADPNLFEFRLFVLRDGQYIAVESDPDGHFHSIVVPDLIVDPAQLFADMDE
jgi:Uma2 family endonuclease